MERREFIHRWGRLALLGGMVATAGYFAVSGRITTTASCTDSGKCGTCSVYASCRDSRRQKPDSHGK